MNKIFQKRTFGKHISSPQLIALSFLAVILLGALLLMLPFATRSGNATPFTNCLFTATSATCVTGLVTYDTFTYWSYFGQGVILVLIQLGGLGFMTIAALFTVIIRKNLSLKSRMTMSDSLNVERTGIIRLIKRIVTGTVLAEAAGAAVLSVRFSFDYSLPSAIYKGIFTSVSAFCNAGFDVFGDRGEFSSLSSFASDPVVILTVAALIIIGGLGFFIWTDIFEKKKIKRFSVFSKVVIATTAFLLLSGAAIFLLMEGNGELAEKDIGEQLLDSFFFSTTLRTAGFSSFDFGALRESTLFIGMLFMFIGGGSGSTAGGIKTSTLAILFFTVKSAMRGQSEVLMGKRRVPYGTVIRAAGITVFLLTLTVLSGIMLSEINGLPLIPSLFEAFSAIGTVGLSTGITPSLSAFSLLWLALLMFVGRVGLLTVIFALTLKAQNRSGALTYPEVKFNIG